jgi:hypothetical protein
VERHIWSPGEYLRFIEVWKEPRMTLMDFPSPTCHQTSSPLIRFYMSLRPLRGFKSFLDVIFAFLQPPNGITRDVGACG